jgi:hypothetical protein
MIILSNTFGKNFTSIELKNIWFEMGVVGKAGNFIYGTRM